MDRQFWLMVSANVILFLIIPVTLFAGAIVFESDNNRCGVCHTEPETTFVARQQLPSMDLATQHLQGSEKSLCVECHGGTGLVGRGKSVVQGAIDLVAFVLTDYDQPASTRRPVGDSVCAKCHSYENSAERQNAALSPSHYHDPEYLTAWQANEQILPGACNQCHPSHLDIFAAPPSEETNVMPRSVCEPCHIALSGWRPDR